MSLTRRLFRSPQFLMGLLLVTVFAIMAVFAPTISPPDRPTTYAEFASYEGDEFRVVSEDAALPQPPNPNAPLGTDHNQYDIFHTLIWGSRTALFFGIVVTSIAATFGLIVGAFSGYVGGGVQRVTLQITDAFLTLPLIAGVWLINQLVFGFAGDTMVHVIRFLEDVHVTPTMIAFILFSWMPYTRVMNAGVLQIKGASFIQAAEALGASRWRIVLRHLIPNAISPLIVLMARDVGAFVTLAAALQVIGIGAASEWGTLLAFNREWVLGVEGNILHYWWVYVPLTSAFILFGFAWNLLGDGLNTVLNPKER